MVMKALSVLIAFLISALFLPAIVAADYSPIDYVSDHADIVDQNYETQINALAEQIEMNSTVEIAVLTVPGLEGGDIDQFAVQTFQDWGIGKKEVNNGLLIVIAVEDRQWRIEVGYGLEPLITDAMAGRIGRANFGDNFRASEYGKGIYEAVTDFQKVIENDPEVIAIYSDSVSEINGLKGFGLLVLPLLLFVILTSIYIAFCKWINSKYSKDSSQSAITKSQPGSAKSFLLKLLVLIIFSLAVWYFSTWILAANFSIVNLLLTLTKKPADLGNVGGGGFLGGGFRGGGSLGGLGGFGGFGGGRSGGGGAGGRW